ncbi:uncharacterized protein [Pagrus major]|uniref:uncharacterized protein n=1 Tax=Pagrus major TaxID=143350 RepID=UPI003CC892BA
MYCMLIFSLFSGGFFVSKGASGTTLRSTSPGDMHTDVVSLALVQKELPLAVVVAVAAVAVLLLSLMVVLYFKLRKHRRGTGRATVGCEVAPSIDTCSTHLTQVETHSPDQLRELDPSVNVSSSDTTYATVISRRGPGAHTSIHHPVTIQTQVADPSSEDVHLLYSTVCFNRGGDALQPGGQIRSAAGPSELYATVQRPQK